MRTLKIIKTEYRRTGYDEADIEKKEYVELIACYDERDNLVKEERFDPDGETNTLTINQYDTQERLVATEQFDGEHVLLQKIVNKYDEQGLLAEQGNYFGEDSTEYITKYIHDPSGNVVRTEMYDQGKLDYIEKQMEYNGKLLTHEIENDEYGNKMYEHHYEYNGKGLLAKHIRDEIQNHDRRTYEYTYDDKGNRIKELVYDYNNTLISKTCRTYNNDGLLIETEEEDLDNYRRISMEYEGTLVLKNTLFNKDGKIMGWAEYSYDENKKEIDSKEYYLDEVNPEVHRLLRETRYERSSEA